MDINKNKVNKPTRVFDKFITKSNTYIPAMHKNSADTFECTTKKVSFKGKTITREDILSRLDKVDMSEEIKIEIKEKMETQEQINLANKFLSDERLYNNPALQRSISCWFSKYDKPEGSQAKIDIMEQYLSDESLQKSKSAQRLLSTALMFAKTPDSAEITGKIFSNPTLYENPNLEKNFSSIMSWSNFPEAAKGKKEIIDTFLSRPELQKNEDVQNIIGNIIQKSNSAYSSLIAIKFLSSPELYKEESLQRNIPSLISAVNTEEKADIVTGFLSNPDLYKNESLQKNVESILFHVKKYQDLNYAMVLFEAINKGELEPELAINLIKNSDKIRYKQVRALRETVPSELFTKITTSSQDLIIASSLLPLYEKTNINEIPLAEKRNILRALLKFNAELFIVGKDLREAFPLLPNNRKEYCSLLPALVKSLGIEVKPLSDAQITKFEEDLSTLSSTISKMSDSKFQSLKINLSYPKNDFIQDAISITKDLSNEEKQRVYDYFGFDLRQNKKNPTGYSLQGYPVNIHNGEKLAQITSTKTKEVIETLRPKVIEFSENNTINTNNKEVEQLLSTVLDAIPELYSTINRPQHGAHEYDVFKHSLKVMQKIVQNPKFEKLDASDKKVMLLASLFHDITKAERQPDPNHATECSFDAFYISKKFNLTKEEQTKLYTLIDTHEWLKYVNQKDLTISERLQRLQCVAFDLQNDNIFELSKMFTEADLKAIKKDDGLFDIYGPVLKRVSPQIKHCIAELQKTKPLLPTTKLPTANDIEKRITTTNSDGSTNIKGVYKKDGLIIIKYNEVENWQELGLEKNNVSHGIKVTNPIDGSIIDTGTIKFIAHGLDEANQLINFSAFNLPDSDALLSVSYMERPESKYRLFRPQGILLDVDSHNIYGGGESDAGSGYKKSITDFKLNYIFDGQRQNDRHYISTLIKENLNLTDEEYIEFVKANLNKSMNEIQPDEVREKLIKSFSLINSNIRQGNREYNEMYVSNPSVQGVYAYSEEDFVGDINSFIEKQPEFIKDYAKQNNLPFFVFGN